MTLIQLRYYQAVCKYKNISKASQALHVSQPAVSIAISNLETEFSVTLLKRDNRTFEITEAGYVFLSLTNDLLANVEAMHNQMKALQNNMSQLRLSVVPFSFTKALHPLLQQYRAACPETQVQVFECNALDAIHKLKSGQIDAALTVDSMDRPSFVDGLQLFKSPSIFAVGYNHVLANQPSCSFEDLARGPLIFTKEDSLLTKQVKKRLGSMGVTPHVFLYSAQSNLIESALQNGQNGAVISEELAQQLKNVRLIPIRDPVEISHLLLWKRATHLNPMISKFIRVVRKYYPEATTY
ncbi:MAG: LysR family transcriptional regulator [Gemmiger sp.]